MNRIISGGYRRITKAEARKRYNAGEKIRLVSCKYRPDNVWGAYADVDKESYMQVSYDGFNTTVARNRQFDTVVQAFTYYNCSNETGRYPAFYVKN